jgi:outer membrane protein assembly factor BamB/tetratricopeptide (TPR) repeat protein
MPYLRRVLGFLLLLTGADLLLFGGKEDAPLLHVLGQTKEIQGGLGFQPVPPVFQAIEPPDPAVPKGDAFTLPLDRSAQQKLEAAEDYIKEQSWKESVRLLQAVLDLKEDSLFRQPADPKKRLPERWTSARAEAERLLAALPPAGREFYQLANEPLALRMLKEAKNNPDPKMLSEIVRRFLYTSSGAEALEMLGTFYLDRAQPALAALAFQRRLERDGHEPIAPLTLFKAVLAFHAVGDKAREQDAWNALGKELARAQLRLGHQAYTLDQLREQLPHWNSLPSLAGDSPLYRGDASRTGRGSGEIPYLEARRRLALTELEEGREWLTKAADSVPPNAVPLPGFTPIAFGDRLIYRSHVGVHAFDIRAGKESWRTPSAYGLDASLSDAGKKVQLAQWFNLYRTMRSILLENTMTGSLSSDGRRVYAVEDLAVPPHPEIISQMQYGQQRYFGPFSDLAHPNKMHNILRALNAETGEVEWQVGSSDPKSPPDLLGVFFLGPPLPLGNSLFVVVEQKQELRLLCLRADRGDVQWAQSLGTARDKILFDMLRRTQAVHPAYADGILVCPTGAGAVLGIDPLGRSLLWAHNYRERPPIPPDPNQFVPEYSDAAVHNCWKHCAPIIQEGRVVFTAPDGDSVRCLDLHTGALLWKASRTEEDLYVGAVSKGKVLIVGKNTCRALGIGNGGFLWQYPTGRPSGTGVLADKTYYLPLQKGEIVALDLDNPKNSSRIETHGGATVGNLLFHGGELWSQTAGELAAFPSMTAHLEQVEAKLRDNGNDIAARLERGELRLARGEVAEAVADLHKVLELKPHEERARRKLYEALTQLLRRDFKAGEKHLDEYRMLSQVAIPQDVNAEERRRLQGEQLRNLTRYYTLLAQGREQQGRLLDALQAYREMFDRTPAGENLTLLDDPSVEVRADLWIQTQIAGIVQRSSPETIGPLREYLEREGKALAGSDDLDAVARFATLFGTIPGPLGKPGREARLRLACTTAETAVAREAVPLELALLALQQEADEPAFSARALYARARLLTRQGLLDDALAVHRTLVKEYPDVVLRDGRTARELLADLATDKRFLAVLHETRPAWQDRKMQAREMSNAGIAMTYQAMSSDYIGEKMPSAQRWRFLVDMQKWQLRVLDRDTMLESWSVPIPPINLRQYGFDGDLFRYRVLNHVVIFNLGTTLVAVDLIERRVRWTYNLFDEPLGFNRGIQFNADGSFLVYTQEGRMLYKLGLVGPVTRTGITVLTRQGLMALDPADGQVRWQRNDVPSQLDVFGDEQYLYLAEYQNDGAVRGIRAVQAADGVNVPIPDAADLFAQKVRCFGRHLLVGDTGAKEEVILRLVDVQTGKDIWRKTLPKDSFLLDSTIPDLAATVTPKGEVSVFELQTGKEIKKLALKPQHMNQVTKGTLLRDPANYYVALVGASDPQGRNLDANQGNNSGDMRLVPVNGMFYVFDRGSGEVKAANRVLNQHVVLNRFEELPVVLFAMLTVRETGPPGSGQQAMFLSTLSMDKKTGKRLFNKEQTNANDLFHTLWVDTRSGIIDLIGSNYRVRHQIAAK